MVSEVKKQQPGERSELVQGPADPDGTEAERKRKGEEGAQDPPARFPSPPSERAGPLPGCKAAWIPDL